MGLFSSSFPIVNTSEELARLQSQYPSLDRAYVALAAHAKVQPFRELIESWWGDFEPYADPNFAIEFQTNFAQRSWELYIGITLLNRGFGLGPNRQGQPDFEVLDPATGRRLAWIEAISVEKGTGIDRVPDTELGKVYDAPIDQILLRLANGLETKHKIYVSYIEKGIVKEDEPFVIAINRSELERISADPEIPLILKVLFGIGSLVVEVPISGDPAVQLNHWWNSRPSVEKHSKATVDISFFRNQAYMGISAVMYCLSDIFNGPYRSNELGENVCVVHNPLAKNLLPSDFFSFGSEWREEKEELKKIRESGSHRVAFVDLLENANGPAC